MTEWGADETLTRRQLPWSAVVAVIAALALAVAVTIILSPSATEPACYEDEIAYSDHECIARDDIREAGER